MCVYGGGIKVYAGAECEARTCLNQHFSERFRVLELRRGKGEGKMILSAKVRSHCLMVVDKRRKKKGRCINAIALYICTYNIVYLMLIICRQKSFTVNL